MAVNRITVTLEQPEYSGLLEMAIKELRDPREQLRHILRQELSQRGLLPDDGDQCNRAELETVHHG